MENKTPAGLETSAGASTGPSEHPLGLSYIRNVVFRETVPPDLSCSFLQAGPGHRGNLRELKAIRQWLTDLFRCRSLFCCSFRCFEDAVFARLCARLIRYPPHARKTKPARVRALPQPD